MKIDPKKFKFIFAVQTLLVILDLCINTLSIGYRRHHSILLVFFIIQDVCLVVALGLLLVTFFSTYVFQAGLVELLYDRFRVTICICIFYFILTTVYYIWILCTQTRDVDQFWTSSFLGVHITQRLVSPVYYYMYKRAAMQVCDPRYYEDVIWEQNHHHQPGK